MNAIVVPTNVAIPQVDATLVGGVAGVLEVAREFKIDSRDMYDMATVELREIIGRKNRLEEARVSMKAPVLAAGRAIDGFFNPLITTLQQAESTYKSGMLAFDRAERIRREEEERQAREAAERERRRIEAEAQRVADEIAARERQEAEALAAQLRAEGQEEAAQEAIADGEAAAAYKAEEIIQTAAVEAQTVTAMAAPVEAPRRTGAAPRQNWVAEVIDMDALIKAAAEGNTLAKSMLTVNTTVLGQQARSLKRN